MSKNKTNPLTKPAVVAPVAPVADPVTIVADPEVLVADPVITVAAKAPDEVKPEAKPEVQPKNKIQVHSTTGGTFINPFTQEEIGPAPVTVTNDSWLKSQVDAKKIEQV